MQEILIKAAEQYIKSGVSVIPTDSNKRSVIQWKQYQEKKMNISEVPKHFKISSCSGLALICGKVSGNLEVIDIDLKNDTTGNMYQNIVDNVPEEIMNKLRVVKTVSGGYHFYYRCKSISGNQKFASRPATAEELKDSPLVSQVVLIESRGEGGYVIAPPTNGYLTISESKEINEITPGEREVLIEICRSFNEVHEIAKYTPSEKTGYGKKPWDDYNQRADIVSLLVKHGWTVVAEKGERVMMKRPGKSESKTSGDYHKGLNLFKVFSSSSQFQPGKGYTPFGVYCILEHKGDASAAAKQLLKDGYGERMQPLPEKIKKPIRKLREAGYTNEQIKEKIVRDNGVAPAEAEEHIAEYDKQVGETISTFWYVDDKGKIKISRHKLDKFLSESGFHLFFYDKQSGIYRIVYESAGMIEEVSIERIKKHIKKYVYSLEPMEPFDQGTTVQALMEVILTGSDSYFSKSVIEFLDEKRFDFFRDTKDACYFTFKNGVVCVTSDGIELKGYGHIDKVIWKSQVIDLAVSVDAAADTAQCEFARFLFLISGQDEEKYEYCLRLIGYLLHKFKHAARPWAVVLAEETDDEQKGGGTGKGIFVKAISHMVKTERMDGKNFKTDKSFAFQRVGLDTKILAIEDVRKNVDFEGLYSIITEGMPVEKKNKDELFISYADSPKIIITTNYTISASGVHSKRRQRVFEFAAYFNNVHTPMDEFGHQLFDDWDEDEWNRFYNLMFLCEKKYLSDGLPSLEKSIKMKRKHIKLCFGEEFLDYFDQILSQTERWRAFGEEYKHFLAQNDFDKKEYSQKRFKKALSESSGIYEIELVSRRNWSNNGLYEFKIKIGEHNVVETTQFEF